VIVFVGNPRKTISLNILKVENYYYHVQIVMEVLKFGKDASIYIILKFEHVQTHRYLHDIDTLYNIYNASG